MVNYNKNIILNCKYTDLSSIKCKVNCLYLSEAKHAKWVAQNQYHEMHDQNDGNSIASQYYKQLHTYILNYCKPKKRRNSPLTK